MGMIGALGGLRALGDTAAHLGEVFIGDQSAQAEADAAFRAAVLAAYASEFQYGGQSAFDRAVNGLNRLPRPILALSVIGLFAFAMIDPQAFAARMQGLAFVPEPLWWLMGAVVSFYFGARELHHRRARPAPAQAKQGLFQRIFRRDENRALDDWRAD